MVLSSLAVSSMTFLRAGHYGKRPSRTTTLATLDWVILFVYNLSKHAAKYLAIAFTVGLTHSHIVRPLYIAGSLMLIHLALI